MQASLFSIIPPSFSLFNCAPLLSRLQFSFFPLPPFFPDTGPAMWLGWSCGVLSPMATTAPTTSSFSPGTECGVLRSVCFGLRCVTFPVPLHQGQPVTPPATVSHCGRLNILTPTNTHTECVLYSDDKSCTYTTPDLNRLVVCHLMCVRPIIHNAKPTRQVGGVGLC